MRKAGSLKAKADYGSGGDYFIKTRRKLEYTDHYNSERKLRAQLYKIRRMPVPRQNVRAILAFHREHALRVKPSTEFKVMNQLYRIFKDYRVPFSRTGKPELMGLVARLSGNGYSDATMTDMKHLIRQFFTWMGRKGEVGWLTGRQKVRVESYFGLEDVRKFLDSCESVEERCFFALLWETGCRVGEVLGIRLKDVSAGKDRMMIRVSGKTGERLVPLFPYGRIYPLGTYDLFREYLKKVAKDRRPGDGIWSLAAYNQAQYRCMKIRLKAGLPQLHLHLFRKSRATYLDENGFTFIQTCRFGGWQIGSRVLQAYILGTGRDLVNAIQKLN